MKIKNVEIMGLASSAIASGYPMMVNTPNEDEWGDKCDAVDRLGMESPSIQRLIKLGNSKPSSGHNCALKGVAIQYDLTCNHVMLPQFMRYSFHDIVSSTSKMHRITAMDLKSSCSKRVRQDIISICQNEIDKYLSMQDSCCSKEFLQEQYEVIMENLPMGLELTMRVTSNYLQLMTIYNQRKNHKMSFWREYCKWIESLPYMKRILDITM